MDDFGFWVVFVVALCWLACLMAGVTGRKR